ncbi:MAG: hypothetical protein JW825_00420 [Candidatus Methanofastidiosa archaeon]|nr:hypothetical protein [Candidatus Methanofastidiosa archaeon]
MAKKSIMTQTDKKKAKMFYTKALPVMIVSILIGLLGLRVINYLLEGSKYLRLALYLWIGVFFVSFMLTNKIVLTRSIRNM